MSFKYFTSVSNVCDIIIVGEPLDEATWLWYNDVVGSKRCTVVDTYLQTGESGWIVFGSRVPLENALLVEQICAIIERNCALNVKSMKLNT